MAHGSVSGVLHLRFQYLSVEKEIEETPDTEEIVDQGVMKVTEETEEGTKEQKTLAAKYYLSVDEKVVTVMLHVPYADEETLKQRNLTIIPNTDNNSITKAYCKINNMYFLSKVRQNSNNVEILLRSSSPIPQIISSNISSLFCV